MLRWQIDQFGEIVMALIINLIYHGIAIAVAAAAVLWRKPHWEETIDGCWRSAVNSNHSMTMTIDTGCKDNDHRDHDNRAHHIDDWKKFADEEGDFFCSRMINSAKKRFWSLWSIRRQMRVVSKEEDVLADERRGARQAENLLGNLRCWAMLRTPRHLPLQTYAIILMYGWHT